MSTVSAGSVVHARYAALKEQHRHPRAQEQTTATTSIEAIVGNHLTNNTSIELPAEITALITGSDYWVRAKSNRYKKLIREGHLGTLLRLAREAQTKEQPANWFAAACSKARWERYTLPYAAKLEEVARKAEAVVRRLGSAARTITRFIYKMIWRGINVERWAIAAQEVPHDRPGQSRGRYFAWLCTHERQLAA